MNVGLQQSHVITQEVIFLFDLFWVLGLPFLGNSFSAPFFRSLTVFRCFLEGFNLRIPISPAGERTDKLNLHILFVWIVCERYELLQVMLKSEWAWAEFIIEMAFSF